MGFLGAFTLRVTVLPWFTASFAFALPTNHTRGSIPTQRIIHAVSRNVVVDEASGIVMNTVDQSSIDQGSASDGAGSAFGVPAVLWLSFGLTVGLYLTLGGMRLWRITTAIAIGLVFALCAWVAIVNVTNAAGGLFKFCRLAGLTALSILGGMSVGMRVVLMREGLLIHPTSLNWIIIVACAVAGFVVTLLRQRIGIALSCTFTGTFFLSLGIDLAANQQNSVSRGLRHLLDGNNAHVLALRNLPYKPPISTQITLSLSIGLALVMAYVQFRFFSDYLEEPSRAQPFSQYFSSINSSHSTEKLDMDTLRLPLQRPPPTYPSSNRFSL
ncbi:hypothetical protein BDM02DRAFT_3258344 [Thelephora ganbajun]|uniref:Uncharacterized protein n=1 Tax=Thelephora ganbajun TaxID=370292 RepID=A0ACB6ZTW1_THEGA|nr:hypothetical protein BDM02DRAFT_3258344 [Thelephora ganbajun]